MPTLTQMDIMLKSIGRALQRPDPKRNATVKTKTSPATSSSIKMPGAHQHRQSLVAETSLPLDPITPLEAQATRRPHIPVPHSGLAPTAVVAIHLSQVVAAAIHLFQVVVVTTHQAAITHHQSPAGEEATHLAHLPTPHPCLAPMAVVVIHLSQVVAAGIHLFQVVVVTTHQAAIARHQAPAEEEATHLVGLLRPPLRVAIIHLFLAEEAAQHLRL